MALQRLDDTGKRIANLETHIQTLQEEGQPTVEAERLFQLMRRSRALMQHQVDLFAKDKS